jgi:hypothetical protein
VKKITCFLIIASVFLCTCRRPEQYSDIPEIKFISFEKVTDENGILMYYFQDGEGDIGLNFYDNKPPFDTSSFYYYNFFCDYYEKQNGVFVKIDSVKTPQGIKPFHLNARIPRLTNLPEESINGEIYHFMVPYRCNSHNDTVKLIFHIVDRKLNHSNEEEVIVIK